MHDRRWAQVAGVAGILFVIFILGSIFSASIPNSTASSADIAAYVTKHHTALEVSSLLGIAASSVILLFFVPLAQIVRARDEQSPLSTIIMVSGTALVALTMLSNVPQAALALASTQSGGLGNAPMISVLWLLGLQVVIPGSTGFLFAIFLGAIGIAMLQRAFGATWLGWLSIVIGLVWIPAGIAATVSRNQTYPNILAIGGLAGFAIVVVATSIFLLRYAPASSSSPEPAQAKVAPS